MTTSDPDREGREGDVPVPPDQDPRPPLDVDTAFAAIVANWSDDVEDDGGMHPWPAEEDLESPRHREGPSPDDDQPAAESPRDTGDPRVIRPAIPDLPDPFQVPPTRAGAEPEERFIPPEPPPLPRGDLFGRLAWAGVLGGPLFLLLAAMVWRDAPQILVLGAVAAFIGGFVALVLRLPQHHDDDGDDGAVV
jgi:hypothetical protein